MSIDGAPLLEVATWAEQYRPIWEGRFARMAECLEVLKLEPPQPRNISEDISEHRRES